MAIKIPDYLELNDDQKVIHDLPILGKYMVTGGPGTGKTIIAIKRTEQIKKDKPSATVSTFLFTNALNDFFGDGIKSLKLGTNVQVWAKWQVKFLKKHNDWDYTFGQKVPEQVWRTLSTKIMHHHLEKYYDHLIIDEAQDYAESDLKVMDLIANHITVFADENQRLYDRGISDSDEIMALLNIDDEDSFHLSENHRNTKEIMRTAVSLAPDEIDVDLDEILRTGQKPMLVSHSDVENEIKFIARVLRANKHWDIGILHLERKVLLNLYEQLQKELGGEINMELMKKNTFDFNNTNPKLCTLNSAKGLEFDIVIMPQMNSENYFEHPKNLKRIYVGMTRARSSLILSYHGSFPTNYLSKIDPDTIKRVSGK